MPRARIHDDPIRDADLELEARLRALHALGPMEFEAGERQEIARALQRMNRLSKKQMRHLSAKRR
jgi:hypothetical protein